MMAAGPLLTEAPAFAQQATDSSIAAPRVSVSDTAPASAADGSTEAGYRVDAVHDIGPFTNKKIQDTPYSLNVLPSDFIQNTQAFTALGWGRGARQEPVLCGELHRPARHARPSAVNAESSMPRRSISFASMACRGRVTFSPTAWNRNDRIEILSGVTGFMYGVSGNAGSINYILKRPTQTPFVSVTAGLLDGTTGYGHIDAGGSIDNGTFGYRVNVAGQNGETFIDDQRVRRYLVSAAFDYRPIDGLLLQLDTGYSNWREDNLSAVLARPQLSAHRISATTQQFQVLGPAVELGYRLIDYGRAARVTWDPTDWFTLRSEFRYTQSNNQTLSIMDRLQLDDSINQGISLTSDPKPKTYSGYIYGDLTFDTGFVHHKLTVGWTGSELRSYDIPNDFAGDHVNGFWPLTGPGVPTYAQPDLEIGPGPYFLAAREILRTYSLGDDIRLNKYFSALIGVSYTNIGDDGFDSTGSSYARYEVHKVTPTYALFVQADRLGDDLCVVH